MKIAIAPDSFKESLSAVDAAEAIRQGVLDACCNAETVIAPMADGGEGTVEAVVAAAGGRYQREEVHDPLGRTVTARFGMLDDSAQTAVIEMAAASGLELLDKDERNPMVTSTRGTGALIRSALNAGARRIIIGVGGSATVDGGIGMAAELGVKFYDKNDNIIENPKGADLEHIGKVDTAGLNEMAGKAEFIVACDVQNPLLGKDGAAKVYGPQKGAGPLMVEKLEKGLENLSRIIQENLDIAVADMPGAGAAGGLGAGLAAFLGAKIESGIRTVIEVVDLQSKLKGCDLVITGEGKADYQSAFGKTPAGVGELAKKLNIPAILLAGKLGEGYKELYRHGIVASFAIMDGPMGLEDAIKDTHRLLRQTTESMMKTFALKNA